MSSEIAVKVRGLTKLFYFYANPKERLKQLLQRNGSNSNGSIKALTDVSFEVRKGETTGIIGLNGSGKSTLLQILCGTQGSSEGFVEVDGRVVGLLDLGFGFHPDFTGRENVHMNAAMLGLSRREIDQRYDDIVEFADIGEFIDRPLRTYSTGMFLRLAFAVVANVNADILLIDEVLSVGDILFTQKCMRFLRKFREQGTILLASHDTSALINLCHRVIWLDKGEVRLQGRAKEVCEAYLEFTSSGHSTDLGVRGPSNIPGTSKDQRAQSSNTSPHRNNLEVFEFDPEANSFGDRGLKIVDVQFMNEAGEQLSWIVGQESVQLLVRVVAVKSVSAPIVGFFVKDRLGQTLFGDNTYLTYAQHPIVVEEHRTAEATFHFRMPILPWGDYSVCVAVAHGTQEEHSLDHWIHDALIFKSQSGGVTTGLVGIPMQSISLEVKE